MSKHPSLTVFCSLLCLSLSSGVQALAQDTGAKENVTASRKFEPVQLASRQLRRLKSNPDQFLQRTIEILYRMNPSGFVTQDDAERYWLIENSRARTRFATRFLHLDLNGDGSITTEERNMVARIDRVENKAQYELLFASGDRDGDGQVSHAELNAYAGEKAKKAFNHKRASAIDPMAFDLNGDRKVNPAEVTRSIREIAKQSPKKVPTKRNRQAFGNCVLPSPPKDAEIVLLSGYQGWGVSTVAVSGLDRETSLAHLTIEPGKRPLYIFATTYDAIVWKVEGATERVAKFVAQPLRGRKGAGVAVTGLAAEKVSFASAGSCVRYFSNEKDAKARISRAQLASKIGRNIDHTIARYRLGRVSIPSGKGENGSSNGSHGTLEIIKGNKRVILKDGKIVELGDVRRDRAAGSLLRFYPGGVVQIDARDAVAPQPVVAYDVLPQQAGLVQLVREGAMSVTPDGFYLIKKDVPRFPAGLNGAHSVKFLLGKGVKMPGGNPGHSPVFLEETGECVGRSGCPR